jgi:hypothetical protein
VRTSKHSEQNRSTELAESRTPILPEFWQPPLWHFLIPNAPPLVDSLNQYQRFFEAALIVPERTLSTLLFIICHYISPPSCSWFFFLAQAALSPMPLFRFDSSLHDQLLRFG